MSLRHVTILLAALGLTALSACSRCGTPAETWQNEWSIRVNAVEKNLNEPGHHPMGWIPGELGPDFVNRPNYEGAGMRAGLLALHPLSGLEPAAITFTGEVPPDKPILVVEASGNVNGDCLLQCVANNEILGEVLLDGSQWTTAEFDLSRFAGQPLQLELRAAAGGKQPWHFEHCYIDNISFKSRTN